MLINILIGMVFIMSSIIFIVLYRSFYDYKKYNVLKIKTNILTHDIKSSLVMFNLTLKSLKELVVTTENQNDEESFISFADLPSLIEVLDEAEKNIFRSISQWNA